MSDFASVLFISNYRIPELEFLYEMTSRQRHFSKKSLLNPQYFNMPVAAIKRDNDIVMI